MAISLTANEARVIGCLIEKEITTPEQYPLSLNALTNACNQKSSREPVLNLSEIQVKETVDALVRARLVQEKTGFGSRVPKYQHRFCNTEFGELKFTTQELGILCVLLLRGPQTPGELRGRTQRLCDFADVSEVEATLEHLASREDGPFVACLAREPGKRESRYVQLFTDEFSSTTMHVKPVPPRVESSPSPAPDRVGILEARVESLAAEVKALREKLDQLL